MAAERRLDIIEVHGAERTRPEVVVRAAGLRPGQILAPKALLHALRRLHDLPVVSNVRTESVSVGGAFAKLDVFIDERKVAPTGPVALATLGARALLLHELRANLAGPLGAGELTSASWRWSAGRPRVAVGLAIPSPRVLPGIVSIEGLWERQSYGTAPSSNVPLMREERHRVGVHLSDWSSRWLHWQTGAALDHFREYAALNAPRAAARNHLALENTIEVRPDGDRLALNAFGSWWAPVAGGARFGTGGLLAAWRASPDPAAASWFGSTEIVVASHAAPLALWPGAGTGNGRSGLLRAHPLIKEGVLTGPAFGRGLARGSFEYARPVKYTSRGGFSVAGFVDAARAWDRLNGLEASPLYVDAGFGVRLSAPGADGAIRIDVAHGIRGGATRLSASWGGAWPR